MTKGDITDFIINVGILLIFRSIYDFYWVKYRETYKNLMQYATGIVVGAVCIMLMIESFGWYSGSSIIIDAKTVLLSLSGLFLGTTTTLIASIMVALFAVYRYFVPSLLFYNADVESYDGILIFDLYSICVAALCGIIFHRHYHRWVSQYDIKILVKLALSVHLLVFLMSPVIIHSDTLYNMLLLSPTLLIAFPVGTVLLGRLMITDASRWDLKAQLLYTEDKFSKVALCTDDCFWEIDNKGFVVYVSDSVSKIIGYSPKEIVGQKPFLYVADIESKNNLVEYARNENTTDTIFDQELVLLHKDGAQIHCQARGIKQRNRLGELVGYIGIIHNCNEQYMQRELMRRNQLQLREQNKQYETLNAELLLNNEKINTINQDLIATKEKLERAEQTNKSFISNISHEIRTPLAIINGYLDTMTGAFSKVEDHSAFVSVVKQQCDDIMLLLDEISDLGKIDEGSFNVNETAGDIGYLFNEICEYYKLRSLYLNNKRIEFIHRLNIHGEQQAVKTDFCKLCQVLKNLINNACRYTDEGEIRFCCSLINNDTEILFEVSDTGKGIDPESLDNIFSRFYQAPANTRGYGSSIGLPVAKAIVEKLGGTIRAESTVGEGASFYVTIPYRQALQRSVDDLYKWRGLNAVVISKDRFLSVYLTNLLMKTDIHYKVYTMERDRTIDSSAERECNVVIVDTRLENSEYALQVDAFLKSHNAPVVFVEQPENGELPDSTTIYESMEAVLSK
ncbi:MAG: PAS domain-containing sensor histidine kinase [Bacteroidales bacterium]|nr:PAS domain-containing sensor histidine kinase [Bacteroidales bacterium]